MTTSRRGSSCRKMRMTRSRLRATVAFAASVVGVNAFSAFGVESRTISLTCKSCVRYMKTIIAQFGGAESSDFSARRGNGHAANFFVSCHARKFYDRRKIERRTEGVADQSRRKKIRHVRRDLRG